MKRGRQIKGGNEIRTKKDKDDARSNIGFNISGTVLLELNYPIVISH